MPQTAPREVHRALAPKAARLADYLVELRGFEPLTSAVYAHARDGAAAGVGKQARARRIQLTNGWCFAANQTTELPCKTAGSRHLGDELRVEIGFERFGASFRAVAGILDPAERQFRQREPVAVD
jgi:hypothetical protein